MSAPAKRRLVTYLEAKKTKAQHTKPCADCPWARGAVKGWLGSSTPEQWLQAAHGESLIDCHTVIPWQCAGSAIYRANVGKVPRDASLLRLPPDKKCVFSTPMEFIEHHKHERTT